MSARVLCRLFVSARLAENAPVLADAGQARYLGSVLRARPADRVCLFNGQDGDWLADIVHLDRQRVELRALSCLRPQPDTGIPDVWLLFAPVKKDGTDMIVQKATELGASVLWPVLTSRTNSQRVNVERLRATAIEAAEQCERSTVPDMRMPERLEPLLAGWEHTRTLYVADETGRGDPVATVLAREASGPAAFLTGPEGGFDPRETELLHQASFVRPVSLGPRILRAETAAMASLTCWQAINGDWSHPLIRPY